MSTAKEPVAKPVPPHINRKMRWYFQFLGLLLIALAGWLAWYSYQSGKLPDLTDPAQQQKALDQLKRDATQAARETVNATRRAAAWAERSLNDLRALIKDKPPETKEEVSALVKESKTAVENKPEPTTTPIAEIAEVWGKPWREAKTEYELGTEIYAKTDPMLPSAEVQKNVKAAEPHFARCLDLLEQARQLKLQGHEIDKLEQAAAKRLYDCRRRIELERAH